MVKTKKVTTSTKTTAERHVKAGYRELVHPETGEVEQVPCYTISEVDINFEKMWLGNMLAALDCLGGKKKEVIKWIIANRNESNQIIATYDLIKDKCKVAKQTVVTVMTALQKADLIRKERNGVYLLNADFMFSGNNKDRMSVMFEYKKLPKAKAK